MSNRPHIIVRHHRILALVLAVLAPLACSAGETAGPETTTSSGTTGGHEPETPLDHAATDACTVFPQAGCSADHTCVVTTAVGDTICESAGTAPAASACGGEGDCALGLTCVGSVCRPFCKAPSDCEGTASACFQVNLGMKPVPGWTTCSLPCNPADPQNVAGIQGLVACAAGNGCFSLDPAVGPQGSTDCFVGGTAAEGAACDTVDCGPGLVCLNDGTTKSCHPFCVMGLTSCTCLSFAEPFYAAISNDIKEVGYCQ